MAASLASITQDFIHLCSKGSLKEALHGFPYAHFWADPSLFSHLVRAACCHSLPWARQLHALVTTAGLSADRFTANHLLLAYSKLGRPHTAATIFASMPRKNVMSYNILVGGLIQNGDLLIARQLFDEMPVRNLATWNAMVAGLTHFGFDKEGLELFAKMKEEDLRPDEFSLGSVFRCCAGLKDIGSGRQIHAFVIVSGFEFDLIVGSSVAHMYMKCGRVEEGERVIQGLPDLNVVCCNIIISGRAQNGDSEGAMVQFRLMKEVGLAANHVTFVGAVSACSDLATLGQGQQVHAQVIKSGVDWVVAVSSSLVCMYSKCGSLDDAARVFFESNDRTDFILLTAMIGAYGFHGRGQEAIELFEKMVGEGMEPSEVTFLTLLYACCHSGLKDKGVEYIELMAKKYGLKPMLVHYTCVVDLLGRAGCLEEAEAMIKSMPVKADSVIWKTLLSACRAQRNVEMAERVAEQVLRLDPEDSSLYVLLSNIRAREQRWDDVSEVRKSMWEKRVRKEPGISWVELKGQVHEFSTGGRSHPMRREIDECLRKLMGKIRQLGYLPDTSIVLHDMEDEEKECNLADHSERLALAFAVLSLPPGAPIRIMKNLRVCEDCHVAFKFVSKITDRQIVVRDTSRFHHFSNGKCSCGDYW